MNLLSTFLERRSPARHEHPFDRPRAVPRPALRAPTTRIFTTGLIASILLAVFGAVAATTNDLSDAEIQGRRLAQTTSANTRAGGKHHEHRGFQNPRRQKTPAGIPVRFQITAAQADSPSWEAGYETTGTNHWL